MSNNIVGLKNRGNTCYLNTAIQCLYNLPELTEYFISNEYLNDLKNRYIELKSKTTTYPEIILSKEYGKLITVMNSTESESVEPKSMHLAIQTHDSSFMGFGQHDAQEALSLILDKLHEGLKYDIEISHTGMSENELDDIMIESIEQWKLNVNNKYSIVAHLFFGQFINKMISLEDINKGALVSKTFEMFNVLNIPIYGKTIYDSLSKYFEKEILETKFKDDNKNEMTVYKEIKLMKIPKYLIIVLKRYITDSSGYSVKSNNSISFPIDNLDLSPYSEGYESIDSTLKLISIGCHYGSLNGGHYYAICRNSIDNTWYRLDDDNVSEFPIDTHTFELFKNGYILIYEKI